MKSDMLLLMTNHRCHSFLPLVLSTEVRLVLRYKRPASKVFSLFLDKLYAKRYLRQNRKSNIHNRTLINFTVVFQAPAYAESLLESGSLGALLLLASLATQEGKKSGNPTPN
jgi:hypothetical protein